MGHRGKGYPNMHNFNNMSPNYHPNPGHMYHHREMNNHNMLQKQNSFEVPNNHQSNSMYSSPIRTCLNHSLSSFSNSQFSPINSTNEKRKPQSNNNLKSQVSSKQSKTKTSLFNRQDSNNGNDKDDEVFNSLEDLTAKVNCDIDVFIKTQKGSR
jgi:hypothetical protein